MSRRQRRGLENFLSSSFEVTTKNNDSRISLRLFGFSVSAWSDQEGVPGPGGAGEAEGAGTDRCPRRGPPPSSFSSRAQRAGASRGRRAAAAAAIRRLQICRPEIRCPPLTSRHLEASASRPGALCKEKEGRGCEEAASERARGEAGRGRSGGGRTQSAQPARGARSGLGGEGGGGGGVGRRRRQKRGSRAPLGGGGRRGAARTAEMDC